MVETSNGAERSTSGLPDRGGTVPVQAFWKNSTGSARAMRYVSLLYAAFFFIQPYYEHSVERWLYLAVVLAAFLLLYFLIPYTEGRTQHLLLAQMFGLAFGYYPVNQSANGLFVYAMVILAFVTNSMRFYVAVLCAVSCGIGLEAWLFHLTPWTAWMAIFFCLVVGLSNFTYTRQQRSTYQLQRANDEIEHLAQLAERERIARDLHDLLGHTLTVIAVKSELAHRILATDPARAAQEIAEVEQTARTAMAEVREAVTGYRGDGLAAEVQRARRTLLAADVQLSATLEPVALEPAQAGVLCLALREGVTNIVRHARASTASLRLVHQDHAVRLELADDGVGVGGGEGNGLRGMRERVGSLHGSVRLGKAAERGSVLVVELPAQMASRALPA